ncbi:hypothetical protein AVEN_226543-1 [Araneus ventricosus]|uniref:Uncharacterized protein n=1 Tax=Araneus ventricosus TaxID=182803 RepID=A0A4Y2TCP0_ARAVE|nr:hypothetical protein AVEN_226543-1 [Araneus ventricosus]
MRRRPVNKSLTAHAQTTGDKEWLSPKGKSTANVYNPFNLIGWVVILPMNTNAYTSLGDELILDSRSNLYTSGSQHCFLPFPLTSLSILEYLLLSQLPRLQPFLHGSS